MNAQPHIDPAQPGPISDTLLDAMINVAHKARNGECTRNEAETMLYMVPELLEELSASRKAIAGMIWTDPSKRKFAISSNVIPLPAPEGAT